MDVLLYVLIALGFVAALVLIIDKLRRKRGLQLVKSRNIWWGLLVVGVVAFIVAISFGFTSTPADQNQRHPAGSVTQRAYRQNGAHSWSQCRRLGQKQLRLPQNSWCRS